MKHYTTKNLYHENIAELLEIENNIPHNLAEEVSVNLSNMQNSFNPEEISEILQQKELESIFDESEELSIIELNNMTAEDLDDDVLTDNIIMLTQNPKEQLEEQEIKPSKKNYRKFKLEVSVDDCSSDWTKSKVNTSNILAELEEEKSPRKTSSILHSQISTDAELKSSRALPITQQQLHNESALSAVASSHGADEDMMGEEKNNPQSWFGTLWNGTQHFLSTTPGSLKRQKQQRRNSISLSIQCFCIA